MASRQGDLMWYRPGADLVVVAHSEAASQLAMGWWICGCRSLPGGCQVRVDGRVLGRWLRVVLAVDHRGLYPTDRAARPVEQRRTLRSAALALDRPGVHEADICAGSPSVSVTNGETDSCSASSADR